MELEALKFWVDVVWKVGTILGLIYLAYKQQRAATESEIKQLDTRLDDHQDRLIRLEEGQQASPGYEDLEKIHDRISKGNEMINGLRESVAALTAEMRNAIRALDLLNRHHYGEGGR